MARKLRVQYPGPIDHVMNRGDRRELIFQDHADRRTLVEGRRPRDEKGECKALRRGWCFGEEPSRRELLERRSEKLGAHPGGSERIESTGAKAKRIVAEEMARRGWRAAEWEQRRKADAEKIKIARRLRAQTARTWGRLAAHLAMGPPAYTADCLRQT